METVAAVFTHNVVPLYAQPNGSSEQVSQGLLGDNVEAGEQCEAFVNVRTADDYSGWVRTIHLRPREGREPIPSMAGRYPNARPAIVGQAFADVWEGLDCSRIQTKLVWGTRVTALETLPQRTGSYALVLLPRGGYEPPSTPLCSLGYVRSESLDCPVRAEDFCAESACELAHRFIGTPYLWGGGTPFGFDCSGFVQRIYAVLGITLPRDAHLQAHARSGKFCEPDRPRMAGDLVFFVGPNDPRGRGITHVGLALNNREFIHAVGKTGVTHSAFDDPEVRTAYTYRGAWRLARSRVKATAKV